MAYWIVKALLTPIFHYFFRIRAEGIDHVPSNGRAILASNHLAVLDSFFLPCVLRRRVTFVAKAEYFEDPKTAWFFRSVGQIPIKRGGGSASMRALDAAAEVLEHDDLFGIYPEGTRSPDGRLHKGHTGVARLALRTGAPILPIAMLGTREVQEIGKPMPNVFRPITVRVGRPIDVTSHAERDHDPLLLRQITDEVMYEIRELSGQEYVDSYAMRRGQEPETPEVPEPARIATLAGVG